MADSPANVARRMVEHPVLGPLPEAAEVTISVDGRLVTAREGEPVAAALLAAGIRVFRTMPVTEEARGGYCMIGRCSDCLMVIDGVLNVRACQTPVHDGMSLMTQHGLGDWAQADIRP
jgi:predicted molibdopterin-dependent oxidoreductase YjgC